MIVTFLVDGFGSRIPTNDAAVQLFGSQPTRVNRMLAGYQGLITAVLQDNAVLAAQIERGIVVVSADSEDDDDTVPEISVSDLAMAEDLTPNDAIALFGLPMVAAFVSPERVIAERSRRLEAGFDFDFGDSRGVHRIGTTPADLAGWDEVTTLAQAFDAIGVKDPIMIVTDTGPCAVTPKEWMMVLIAAAKFRQPIWTASFILQAMSPIPVNYADDKYWA